MFDSYLGLINNNIGIFLLAFLFSIISFLFALIWMTNRGYEAKIGWFSFSKKEITPVNVESETEKSNMLHKSDEILQRITPALAKYSVDFFIKHIQNSSGFEMFKQGEDTKNALFQSYMSFARKYIAEEAIKYMKEDDKKISIGRGKGYFLSDVTMASINSEKTLYELVAILDKYIVVPFCEDKPFNRIAAEEHVENLLKRTFVQAIGNPSYTLLNSISATLYQEKYTHL